MCADGHILYESKRKHRCACIVSYLKAKRVALEKERSKVAKDALVQAILEGNLL